MASMTTEQATSNSCQDRIQHNNDELARGPDSQSKTEKPIWDVPDDQSDSCTSERESKRIKDTRTRDRNSHERGNPLTNTKPLLGEDDRPEIPFHDRHSPLGADVPPREAQEIEAAEQVIVNVTERSRPDCLSPPYRSVGTVLISEARATSRDHDEERGALHVSDVGARAEVAASRTPPHSDTISIRRASEQRHVSQQADVADILKLPNACEGMTEQSQKMTCSSSSSPKSSKSVSQEQRRHSSKTEHQIRYWIITSKTPKVSKYHWSDGSLQSKPLDALFQEIATCISRNDIEKIDFKLNTAFTETHFTVGSEDQEEFEEMKSKFGEELKEAKKRGCRVSEIYLEPNAVPKEAQEISEGSDSDVGF